MSRIYRVDGMHCDGCVRAVTRAIQRRAAAAKLTAEIVVDLARHLVTVSGEVPAEAVAAAVGDAGFAFAGPAEPAA